MRTTDESYAYDKRNGLIGLDKCPLCGRRLIALRKRLEHSTSDINMKTCPNPSCIHYADLAEMRSWVDEREGPTISHGPAKPIRRDAADWVYKINRQDDEILPDKRP